MGRRRLREARALLTRTACVGLVVALTSCGHDAPLTTEAEADWGTYDLGAAVEVDNGAGLVVSAEAGDADAATTLSLAEGVTAAPDAAWGRGGFTTSGPVTEISVDGPLEQPLTVSFPVGDVDVPQESVPVVLRHDEELGWYPVAVGEPGGTATAERDRFSEHAGGHLDLGAWWNGVVTSAQQTMGYRSEPPSCHGTPPAWAQVQSPVIDVVHTCLAPNGDRAEVRLKNNRGITLEVAVPTGIAYAWVDGQPDGVRALVRDVVGGGRDIVLLRPGKEMTIGFDRPRGAGEQVVGIPANATNVAILVDLIATLAELGSPGDEAIVAVVAITKCTDVPGVTGLDVPEGLDGVRRLADAAWNCLMVLAGDRHLSAGLAESVVALANGVDVATVRSDWRRYGARLDAVTGDLRALATLTRIVELAKLAGVYYELVGELLAQIGSDVSLTDTVVRLTPAAAPNSRPQPVTLDWGGGIVGLESPAPEDAAVRFLTERLGPPDDVFRGAMCEMGAPAGARYTWGNLTVLVQEDMTGYPAYAEGPSVVGWEYWENKTGADRQRLRTTDGLGLGSTLDEVRAAVPDGELGDDVGGRYYQYRSGDLWNMTFSFDLETGTEVVAISSGLGCGE